MSMAQITQLQALAEETWIIVRDYMRENKLTASLIAVNVGLVGCYVYWKSSRYRRLIDRIPGIKDYPFVGDLFYLEADPCGE